MTKDEARVYLYSAIEEVALHLLSSNEAERAEAREFIDEHLDAFAQAHTDAALADTLRLLEAITMERWSHLPGNSGKVTVPLWDGRTLDVLHNLYSQTKMGGFAYRVNPRSERDVPKLISRAEAEALLGGKEKKE